MVPLASGVASSSSTPPDRAIALADVLLPMNMAIVPPLGRHCLTSRPTALPASRLSTPT